MNDSQEDMIPQSEAYRWLGVENVRFAYDPGKRAVIVEILIGRPLGESVSGKSIVYAGTLKGQVELNRVLPQVERGLKISISVFKPKPSAILAARKRKNFGNAEIERLRGERND